MERDEHIADLFRKYLADDYTKAELDEILRYFGRPVDENQLDELVTHELGRLSDIDADRQALIDSISATVERHVFSRTRPGAWHRYRWIPYAAAVLLVASVVGYFAVVSQKSSVLPTGQAGDRLAAEEILPGGNRATLTLADGRTVDLSSEQSGIIVGTEDITYDDGTALEAVILSGEGEVSRGGVEGSLPNSGDASVMLALTTPKGGTYQITLPDGSKVWLNSASTLKYPSRFSGDSREVILEGEAYFDIRPMQGTRDTRAPASGSDHARAPTSNPNADGARVSRVPFKVKTAGQTIEVLGTQFNISAYADEAETKTTLVEGKVKVTPGTEKGSTQTGLSDFRTSGLSDYVLTPGQQAITRAAATTINEVDVNQYTAWKSGRFSFAGKPFDQVMRELARWYDIDVRFEGGVPDKALYGGAFRDHDWTSVLLLLETADVDYRMDRRTLTIMNKAGGHTR